MEKLLKFGCIFCLLLISQSCSDDEATLSTSSTQTKLTFSFETDDASKISSDAYATVTVQDLNGNDVLTDHPLKFRFENEKFTTDELGLPAGQYKLKDFTVRNEEEILYEAAGSGAEELSYSFSVSPESNNHQELRKLRICKEALFVMVFAPGRRVPVPTSATAHIMSEGEILKTYDLRTGLNKLHFDFDPATSYQLVIQKKGYAKQGIDINTSHLRRPLVFHLIPAFTMVAVPSEPNGNIFEFILDATPGAEITINWGDGTSESFTFVAPSFTTTFTKNYATADTRYVTVTGDIDEINYFYSFYGNGDVEEIDFYALTALSEIRFGLTPGPAIVDLSNNDNLVEVRVPGINNMEQLLLPPTHFIDFIDFSGYNSMNTAAIDAVIASVYTMAVAYNITGGTIGVQGHWSGSELEPLFIGPPSATGLSQLEYLRDVKGWTVAPESW